MGFDYIFDTNFSADLTIAEEAAEFVERFTPVSYTHLDGDAPYDIAREFLLEKGLLSS